MNRGWVYREQIKLADAGQTVLGYYSQKYRHSSPRQWQERIVAGQIHLNDKPAQTTTVIQPQDSLAYYRQPWVEPPVPLNFETIYEDKDLLVINKPSGLPVLPGGNFLEHTLWWQLKQHYAQDVPVPIHRLGRGTSGLMLLGRSQLAKSHLAQQMRDSTLKQNQQLRKVYRALVSGTSIPERLSITQPIGKIPHPVLGYIYGATDSGKAARSECRVIERYTDHTLLEIQIYTGRPHQIRIHLAAIGYPLFGDPLYIAGGTFAAINSQQRPIPVPSDCGYFLHAHQLSLVHPRSVKGMSFKSPTSKAWQTVYQPI